MIKPSQRTVASLAAVALAALSALSLTACSDETLPPPADSAETSGGTEYPAHVTSPDAVVLTFDGTRLETSVQDSGIQVEGSAFVITRGGLYELRGSLQDGQVRIAVDKGEDVELVLNGFSAVCNTTSPLYVESAGKTEIYLVPGTVNSLTDGIHYRFPSSDVDKPNACLYSADDLVIKGEGSLTVTGYYNNGIGCRNDLRIQDCTLTVTEPNNILKGNDSVEIHGANLRLTGGEDAIKADTTDRADKGYILIAADSRVEISCSDDALQATLAITVEEGAAVTGRCGGDMLNCPGVIIADAQAMQMRS